MAEDREACPECGASQRSCGERFEKFLALEFEDPGYGPVHHLTVTAYMLQHSSRLSREGWIQARELLREFLVDKKDPAAVRRERSHLVDAGRRDFKISSRDGQSVIEPLTWSRTIADVRSENPEQYGGDIQAWARSVLADCDRAKFRVRF